MALYKYSSEETTSSQVKCTFKAKLRRVNYTLKDGNSQDVKRELKQQTDV